MANHSSILAWRIPWAEGPGGLTVPGALKESDMTYRTNKNNNHEPADVQAGFRKGRRTRDQIANICWIIKKARVPENHLLSLLSMPKPLTM